MITLSPDGAWYMRDAMGYAVPTPYQRRWLLPRLLGPFPHRWAVLTYASLLLTPVAAYLLLKDWRAAALLCALPGVWRCSLRYPVLTDAPAFALALVTAWAANSHPWLMLPLTCLLGSMRESAPIFAALWAWNPLPLIGLLAAGWRRQTLPAEDEWLKHPWREAWKLRREIGPDWTLYLRPWGAALLGLGALTPQAALTLAVAHAQLFLALDTVRLTIWGAVPLCALAANMLPPQWFLLALLFTVFQREQRV